MDFLTFIQPGVGLCEIRAFRDGKVYQQWFTDRRDAEAQALDLDQWGWDAYYGVLPRLRAEGTAQAVIPWTDVLWTDLDAKAYNGNKDQALRALLSYDIQPSVIVDSGHGYHAYWKLAALVPFAGAHATMKGIAKQLHGDHTYDAPRILRVPGTYNRKDEIPIPVRVIRFDTTRVMRHSDFVDATDIGAWAPPPRNVEYVPPGERKPLPDWLESLIREGAPQGSRSEQAYKVMCQLAERGWSDAEIRQAFEGTGIGEKMMEMGQEGGERWFTRSLGRARASLRGA